MYVETKDKENYDRNYLDVLLCSANMNQTSPINSDIPSVIPYNGDMSILKETKYAIPRNLRGKGSKKSNKKSKHFDIIVIGLQEARFKKMQEEKKDNDVHEPEEKESTNTAYSVLAAYNEFTSSLATTPDFCTSIFQHLPNYECMSNIWPRVGNWRLMILVHDDIKEQDDVVLDDITWEVGNCGGRTSMLPNKGGICATLNIRGLKLSFLNAHLTAHEGADYYEARCENIGTLLEKTSSPNSNNLLDASLDSHYFFLLGDLNFRLVIPYHLDRDSIIDFIKDENWEALNELDEFQNGLNKNEILSGFSTLPCYFPPTFKVEKGSDASEFRYIDNRIPSYTDRIAWNTAHGLEKNIQALLYEPCNGFTTSDHRAVRGAFQIFTPFLQKQDKGKAIMGEEGSNGFEDELEPITAQITPTSSSSSPSNNTTSAFLFIHNFSYTLKGKLNMADYVIVYNTFPANILQGQIKDKTQLTKALSCDNLETILKLNFAKDTYKNEQAYLNALLHISFLQKSNNVNIGTATICLQELFFQNCNNFFGESLFGSNKRNTLAINDYPLTINGNQVGDITCQISSQPVVSKEMVSMEMEQTSTLTQTWKPCRLCEILFGRNFFTCKKLHDQGQLYSSIQ